MATVFSFSPTFGRKYALFWRFRKSLNAKDLENEGIIQRSQMRHFNIFSDTSATDGCPIRER